MGVFAATLAASSLVVWNILKAKAEAAAEAKAKEKKDKKAKSKADQDRWRANQEKKKAVKPGEDPDDISVCDERGFEMPGLARRP